MPSATNSIHPFSPAELSYLHTSLSSVPPIRPDFRSPTDFRPLNAETGILPATNGSAHVSFSDGSEAIVGVKLEIERTSSANGASTDSSSNNGDEMEIASDDEKSVQGKEDWVSLSLTLPGVRDDDTNLAFLEEMLREPLITGATSSLQQQLPINKSWHWHIYIDVLLISTNGLASYPLPLLSLSTNLALQDTSIPKLKSEGEEDPIADDDWMNALSLYPQAKDKKPPVTLLVVVAGENIIFDPSLEELKVADGIIAISVGKDARNGSKAEYSLLGIRMIDTPARDTMKGIPKNGVPLEEGVEMPGVWRPRVGGIKRAVMKKTVKMVLEDGGVAEDVMNGLEGFLKTEKEKEAEMRKKAIG